MKSPVWKRWFVVTIGLAAVIHVAVVWLVPVVIMRVFMSRVAAQYGVNRVITQPLPTDFSRTVVKPSPDLLYGVCVFDVSVGPVRLSITPPTTYWSLSLFDTNTDNFFTFNANDLKVSTADLILGSAGDSGDAAARFPSARFVVTPHNKGVMLARLLVLDKTNMDEALAAQKSIQCNAIKRGS